MIVLTRLNRILEIDLASQRVVVEPGVANLDVTRAVEADGWFYAPDPSSQQVCTVGGNVAENSGGAHCLKNGFTVNHVTGLTVVLPDGELVELGDKALDPDGYDLLGAFVGSEGTLGIATRITLRILRAPRGGDHAPGRVPTRATTPASAVSGVIGAGHRAGRDRDDGPAHDRGRRGGVPPRLPGRRRGGAPRRARRDRRPGRRGRERGRGDLPRLRRLRAQDREGRRGARAPLEGPQGSVRRRWAACRPTTTSRTASCRARGCPRCCAGSPSSSDEYGLRVGNVFHAGDGNLHPLVLYDEEQGRGGAGEGARRGDPHRLSRRRRLAHRGARRRRRQGVRDAADVLGARPRDVRAAAPGVRSGRARESRQGDPDAAAVRRGAGAVSHASAREDRALSSVSELATSSPATLAEASAFLAEAQRSATGRCGSAAICSPTARPRARARGG